MAQWDSAGEAILAMHEAREAAMRLMIEQRQRVRCSDEKWERLKSAYWAMNMIDFRPATGDPPIATGEAGGDVIEAEAARYAWRFMAEEETDTYYCGCSHYDFNRATIWALEAIRLMNGGLFWSPDDDPERQAKAKALVPQLLRMAAAEYEKEVEADVTSD